jgi:predicted nucleic acid-binding protein
VNCYYVDASALVKRYVDETGSDWFREIIDPEQAPLLFTSRMTIVEVISAFARRVREGALTHTDFASARDAFRSDCLNNYQLPDYAS